MMNEPHVTYCAVCGKVCNLSTVNPTVNAAAGNYVPFPAADMTSNAGNNRSIIIQQYPLAAGTWIPSYDMCMCCICQK